jgi:hypothetical protein
MAYSIPNYFFRFFFLILVKFSIVLYSQLVGLNLVSYEGMCGSQVTASQYSPVTEKVTPNYLFL